MSRVIALGYLGIFAPDLVAWQKCAEEVLGLQAVSAPAAEAEDGLYLRMDERAWRIAVHEGEPGMAYAGYEVANEAALEALVAKLEADGVVVKHDPSLASARGVTDLVQVSDPAGNTVELFCGAVSLAEPFRSPQGVDFVTTTSDAESLGLGHIVLGVPDLDAAKHFYLELLGFKVSDSIDGANFLHANPRHHSLALIAAVNGRPRGLYHFMLQVTDIDTVGRCLDRVSEGAAVLQTTLGRHTNDQMVSFYVLAPGGLRIEYGYGAREVNDSTWTAGAYDKKSHWGHKRLIELT